jgi:hypothetical protein
VSQAVSSVLGWSATGMPNTIQSKHATREEMDYRATMTRELKTMETTSSQQLAVLLEGLSKSLLRIIDWCRVDKGRVMVGADGGVVSMPRNKAGVCRPGYKLLSKVVVPIDFSSISGPWREEAGQERRHRS